MVGEELVFFGALFLELRAPGLDVERIAHGDRSGRALEWVVVSERIYTIDSITDTEIRLCEDY
ncbi:hypothetical protein JCM18750_19360 [Halostagnicola bangensis]